MHLQCNLIFFTFNIINNFHHSPSSQYYTTFLCFLPIHVATCTIPSHNPYCTRLTPIHLFPKPSRDLSRFSTGACCSVANSCRVCMYISPAWNISHQSKTGPHNNHTLRAPTALLQLHLICSSTTVRKVH